MSAPIQRHHNDVNVTQTGNASGRGGASRQGAPDRHQANNQFNGGKAAKTETLRRLQRARQADRSKGGVFRPTM